MTAEHGPVHVWRAPASLAALTLAGLLLAMMEQSICQMSGCCLLAVPVGTIVHACLRRGERRR